MKKMKRCFALLLALAMLLSLSACGSFEKKMTKAAAKMSKLESVHVDMDLQVEMELAVMGQNTAVDVQMTAGIDMNREPFAMQLDMKLSTVGVSQKLQGYIYQQGDEYVMALSTDGGKTYEKETISMDGGSISVSTKDSVKLLSDCADSFTETGSEQVSGYTATRYDGEITAAQLAEAMDAVGAEDTLDERLDIELDEEAFAQMGSIPVSIWVDNRSGMIVRYEMDFTGIMQSVMEKIVAEAILGAAELQDIQMELELTEAVASMDFSQFDKVPAIEIPEEAK